MKIAYFGYDLFYKCLEKILEDSAIEVLKVFSFPENYDDKNENVKKLAYKNKIPFTEQKVTKSDIAELIGLGCELIVCAGYAYRIPMSEKLLGINLHPSLLPVGRGAWPMPLTILKGLSKTGLTVHQLSENFDDGKILAQKEHQVSKDENLPSLNSWISNNCAELMYSCVKNYKELLKNAKTQGKGEYWNMPTKADMTISEATGFEEADRISRAFYGSGFFYVSQGREIEITFGYVSKNPSEKYKSHKVNGGFLIETEADSKN